MISLEIDDLDDDGRGLGRHEGRCVHVAGALPGDRVAVEVEHLSPHKPEAWARKLTLLHPSPDRGPAVCPATGRCGGCPLGELRYEAQLAWKSARIARLAATLAGAPTPAPIAASPRATSYRGHAKLVYGRTSSGLCLGAYAPRSHELVDLAGCRVIEPVLEEVRAALLAGLGDLEPYDERTGQGRLAYVALRSNARGEVLVTLVMRDIDRVDGLDGLTAIHPAIVGVSLNERPRGNAIFGPKTRPLVGRAFLEEEVGPVRIRLSPTAFFQVNRDIAAAIYAELTAALGGRGPVVDAYAGVGGIALTLAHAGAEVIGVEVNAAAVEDAAAAAKAQGLPARFIAADAASGLRQIATERAIDAIVVNPPRKGLDPAMLEAIRSCAPARLAYVSCDPDTLFRDLAVLAASGLRVVHIRPYDMHPQTAHIETLALLER